MNDEPEFRRGTRPDTRVSPQQIERAKAAITQANSWCQDGEFRAKESAMDEAYSKLAAENARVRDALIWAVEWMEQWEGEVMPEWREWQARARAALDIDPPATASAPAWSTSSVRRTEYKEG